MNKVLTKNLINGHSILNGANYSAENRSENYLVFQPAFKYFQTFTGTDEFLHWNLKDCHQRVSKFQLHQLK